VSSTKLSFLQEVLTVVTKAKAINPESTATLTTTEELPSISPSLTSDEIQYLLQPREGKNPSSLHSRMTKHARHKSKKKEPSFHDAMDHFDIKKRMSDRKTANNDEDSRRISNRAVPDAGRAVRCEAKILAGLDHSCSFRCEDRGFESRWDRLNHGSVSRVTPFPHEYALSISGLLRRYLEVKQLVTVLRRSLIGRRLSSSPQRISSSPQYLVGPWRLSCSSKYLVGPWLEVKQLVAEVKQLVTVLRRSLEVKLLVTEYLGGPWRLSSSSQYLVGRWLEVKLLVAEVKLLEVKLLVTAVKLLITYLYIGVLRRSLIGVLSRSLYLGGPCLTFNNSIYIVTCFVIFLSMSPFIS
ncbi:hypothetical protein L9F63_017414, partial [Diploptera punctata]